MKKQSSNIETIRHSFSHILAAAVLEMFPGTQLGIGPAIENGFYYDFQFANKREFEHESSRIKMALEQKMRELIKKDLKFKKKELSVNEAKKIFKDQPYKLELIDEIKKEKKLRVTSYELRDFIDLCKGPHVKSTKELEPDAFKLTKIAGAYWRGDEKNPMLVRIYGAAFLSQKELDEHLKKQSEAEKRDHRKLGQELDLFHFDERFGAGLALWHPKGALLRQIIEDYWLKEHLSHNYEILRTPHIARLELWKTSGHWNFYRENMYSPMKIEEEKYIVKPMNCPGHILIYKNKIRSYRELPLRWAELGTVYRYEKSGVLHGLTRVRGFTQDDAHIFCAPKQLNEEIKETLKLGLSILKKFGFKDYEIYLSTKPKKYVGTDKNWEKATKALKYGLDSAKLKYQIDPGEGVFYGPKIDVKIKDSLGRAWQCTTIQVDFNLPERFKMSFINDKGKKEQPIMLHRALLGSIERFVGVLLEHYNGALPTWLAPVQVWLIPIGKDHQKYLETINQELKNNGIRTELKFENETVSKKIREGEMQKIPYMLAAGDKEIKAKSVRVRHRQKGDLGEMKTEKFIEKINKEIKEIKEGQ